MIAAIVPAAGRSSRMGHPKALLTYRGEPFLTGILAACYAAGIERRVAVLGADHDTVLRSIDLGESAAVVSDDLAAGPIGSVRTGLRILADHPIEAVLVWPVDRPHVATATIEALLDGFRSSGKPIVVPAHGGRRGHPVVFGRAVFDELRAAPDDEGARAVVRADPSRVHEVAVDDPAVLEDFNTPDEYHRLLRREDRLRE